MDKKPLPLGIDDFEKLITGNYYYVDKTDLIKDLLDMKGEVNLFTRPRRFGKTLNMSMLRCFFENTGEERKNEKNRALFKNLNISKYDIKYREQMATYPVISLSLKSGKQPDFDLAMVSLKRQIANVEVRYIYNHTILNWFRDEIKGKDLSRLFQAIIAGESDKVELDLSKLLMDSISFMDSKEAFYHGFLLGILGNMKDFLVKSNRESGQGRYDILVRSLDVRVPVAIFELKVSETFKGMDQACDSALRQIDDKEYAAWLPEEGYTQALYYGIAFFKKQCRVKVCRRML